MARIIDGKAVSEAIQKQNKKLASDISESRIAPVLAVIDTAPSPQTEVYIRNKKKSAESLGIKVDVFSPQTETETIELIVRLNADANTTAIIVQMPLRKGFSTPRVVAEIDPEKDVDCLGQHGMGKIVLGDEALSPPTAEAVMKMIEASGAEVAGANVVIVNNSNIIGKPLAMMLTNRMATVTLCNVRTRDLPSFTRQADILVTATGVPGLIKGDMVKRGAVVIDSGIAVVEGRITGDVDFDGVSKKASCISPVPGGVGPVTVALLMRNILNVAAKGGRHGA